MAMQLATPARDPRDALLGDPKLRASIRKTLRSHGAPDGSIEDLVQDTLSRARVASLPEGDAEARKYIHGIAVHLACDHRKHDAEHHAVEFDECTCSLPSADPDGHELRDGMTKIFATLHERFPRAYHFFEAMYVHGESSQDVARRTGVSDSYVRAGASQVRQTAAELFMQIGIGVAVLLLFVGVGNELRDRMRPVPQPDVAHTTQQHVPTPKETGVELRKRGLAECDKEQWKACLDDLDQARALDPEGDDAHARMMRDAAAKMLSGFDPTAVERKP